MIEVDLGASLHGCKAPTILRRKVIKLSTVGKKLLGIWNISINTQKPQSGLPTILKSSRGPIDWTIIKSG